MLKEDFFGSMTAEQLDAYADKKDECGCAACRLELKWIAEYKEKKK